METRSHVDHLSNFSQLENLSLPQSLKLSRIMNAMFFPLELVSKVIEYLYECGDCCHRLDVWCCPERVRNLRQIRLASRAYCQLATPLLYRDLYISAIPKSVQKAKCILRAYNAIPRTLTLYVIPEVLMPREFVANKILGEDLGGAKTPVMGEVDHTVDTYRNLYANDAAQWDEPEDFMIALSNVLAYAVSINKVNIVDDIYEERLRKGKHKLTHMTNHAIACAQRNICTKADTWHCQYNDYYGRALGKRIRTENPGQCFYSLMAMIHITGIPVKSLHFVEFEDDFEPSCCLAIRQVSLRDYAHTSSIFSQLTFLDLFVCGSRAENGTNASFSPETKHVGHIMQSAQKLQYLGLIFRGENLPTNALDIFLDNLRTPNLQSLTILRSWEATLCLTHQSKIVNAVKGLSDLSCLHLDGVDLDGGTWHDLIEALRDQTSLVQLSLVHICGGLPKKWLRSMVSLSDSLLRSFFVDNGPNPFTDEGWELHKGIGIESSDP